MSKRRKNGLTKSQAEEVEWLSLHFPRFGTPTDDDIMEFVEVTVGGKKPRVDHRGIQVNPLLQAKRALDMTVKAWREDVREGLLFKFELLEDDDHPYMRRLVKSLPQQGWPFDSKITKKMFDDLINETNN